MLCGEDSCSVFQITGHVVSILGQGQVVDVHRFAGVVQQGLVVLIRQVMLVMGQIEVQLVTALTRTNAAGLRELGHRRLIRWMMVLVEDLRQRESNLSLGMLFQQVFHWLLVARFPLVWLPDRVRHIVEAFQQRISMQFLA